MVVGTPSAEQSLLDAGTWAPGVLRRTPGHGLGAPPASQMPVAISLSFRDPGSGEQTLNVSVIWCLQHPYMTIMRL